MIDSLVELKKHIYEYENVKKDIKIDMFGDLHECESFKDKKLDIIKENIDKSNPDYIIIAGDLLDSTNFLYKNNEKRTRLIKWLESLAKDYKTFIDLGSHDYSYFKENHWIKDFNTAFWNDIASISNIYVSNSQSYYEDNNIIIFQYDPDFKYYYNEKKKEDKNTIINDLKKQKDLLTNLKADKIKVFVSHSPIHMTNREILENIKEFDFITSGHMHNGILPPIIDKIIPGNRGIIAPNKSLFPDNSRNIKNIKIGNKEIHLIINGGISKLNENTGILQKFNIFFPMAIDEINIKKLSK